MEVLHALFLGVCYLEICFHYRLPPPPQKKNYNRTVSIDNVKNCKPEYALGIYTNYLHFGETPIRFGSVVTKKSGFLIGMS